MYTVSVPAQFHVIMEIFELFPFFKVLVVSILLYESKKINVLLLL